MSSRRTLFNDDWLKDYPWLIKKDIVTGCCQIYHKDIKLSNMSVQAIISHMNGKKHIENVEAEKGKKNLSISSFCSAPSSSTSTTQERETQSGLWSYKNHT